MSKLDFVISIFLNLLVNLFKMKKIITVLLLISSISYSNTFDMKGRFEADYWTSSCGDYVRQEHLVYIFDTNRVARWAEVFTGYGGTDVCQWREMSNTKEHNLPKINGKNIFYVNYSETWNDDNWHEFFEIVGKDRVKVIIWWRYPYVDNYATAILRRTK